MKVIVKPKGYEVYDAIRVQDHIGKVLIDKEDIHQEIVFLKTFITCQKIIMKSLKQKFSL